jgi:peptidoglycan/xylan/chitin deacetylase (PgdA/CDA1 family)
LFDLTLSFDNGPEPDVTPVVLDALARRDIKTTFFVIGEKIADPVRRRLAERAHDEGHWIGNHTYTHSTPLGRLHGNDVADREVGRTQQTIGSLAHPNRWFRPFGGGGNLDEGLLRPQVVSHLVSGRYS